MTNWIARIFAGTSPRPPGATEAAVKVGQPSTVSKDQIDSMSAAELTRELEKSGYKIVARDGHHLVAHAKLGKFQRHAYDNGDLASILRKEMAEPGKAV